MSAEHTRLLGYDAVWTDI